MYKLVIATSAEREIKRLKKIYREALLEVLEDIKEDPTLGKPLTRELAGRWSYKIGGYRIIYKANTREKVVQVVSAGHRSTVYE